MRLLISASRRLLPVMSLSSQSLLLASFTAPPSRLFTTKSTTFVPQVVQCRTRVFMPICRRPLATLSEPPSVSSVQAVSTNSVTTCTTADVNPDLLSPMLRHYVLTKRSLISSLSNPSSPAPPLVLLYRVGDFFESFFEDAHTLSNVTDLALTSKDAGKALNARVPMAGLPHFAVDPKIRLLLDAHYFVAVVDQTQPAINTPPGRLVERKLTRLITPGTATDDAFLDANQPSYLAAIVHQNQSVGFAYADVSTGEFRATQVPHAELASLLANVSPREILVVGQPEHQCDTAVVVKRVGMEAEQAEQLLASFYAVDSVESLGLRERPLCLRAAAEVLSFVRGCVGAGGDHVVLDKPEVFDVGAVMSLDESCLRNLEIVCRTRDGARRGSLLWAVDRTRTAMGARCLRGWLMAPSTDVDAITARHDVIDALQRDGGSTRRHVQDMLTGVADLERIVRRVGGGKASPREMRWLCDNILKTPKVLSVVRNALQGESMGMELEELVASVGEELLQKTREVVDALVDPAPALRPADVGMAGGRGERVFVKGYNEELDNIVMGLECPSTWIEPLEEELRKLTGVDAAKIKYVKNTGYVLRVPRSTAERLMGEDPLIFGRLGLERVQSTKAEVRFRWERLREAEQKHAMRVSEVVRLEIRLLDELQVGLQMYVEELRRVARRVAAIDALSGLAQVAEEWGYVRPEMRVQGTGVVEAEGLRHPVVEQLLKDGRTFVGNEVELGKGTDVMVLTGPNASGKSVYLRSVGLLCVLAQAGSFVPADRAILGVVGRVMTRVGAVDDVGRGESTFMVEMAETARILNWAEKGTGDGVVLLDEVGRGTGVWEGMGVAWAVVEWLGKKSIKTVFATHFEQVKQVARECENVEGYGVEVHRMGHEWVSTHRVIKGKGGSSMGLEIARRAGLPQEVVNRAGEMAEKMEMNGGSERWRAGYREGYEEATRKVRAEIVEHITKALDAVS